MIGQKGHSSFCVDIIHTFVLTNVNVKWAVSFLTDQTYGSSTLEPCWSFFLVDENNWNCQGILKNLIYYKMQIFLTPAVSITVQCKGQEGVAALKECKYVNQP